MIFSDNFYRQILTEELFAVYFCVRPDLDSVFFLRGSATDPFFFDSHIRTLFHPDPKHGLEGAKVVRYVQEVLTNFT